MKIHFQVLAISTVLYLVAIFWLMPLSPEGDSEAKTATMLEGLYIGVMATAVYLSVSVMTFAHGLSRWGGKNPS